MNEKYIEETLKNHRMNKMLLWSALIVTSGGTVGVFFKALNTLNLVFEWIFVIVGVFLICIFFNLIENISTEISKLNMYLKKEGK